MRWIGPDTLFAPTIVADIKEGARLVDEEPFGPILPIIRYTDIEDVIRRANNTRYGLGGSVWTNNIERGAAIAARLEAGTTWVNQHSLPDPHVPFGGAKESGARPRILGPGPEELYGSPGSEYPCFCHTPRVIKRRF
jgi:acyl-CoA reductase-like NAD-dependent aldehyde dehydrogenase